MLDTSYTKDDSPKLPMTLSQRLSRFQKEHSYTAYIYGVLSNVFLVALQMNMKIVSGYINPLHALAIRGFFLLVMNSIILHFSNLTLNIKDPSLWRTMVKRILFSAVTVSMFLAPLKYVPAGTVNALFNTAPIIVCFVQAVRYKKPLNFKHFLLTIVSFIGILLVIQPDFLFGHSSQSYQKYKYYLLFSLASAFTNSISMSYLHDLKGKMSPHVALHYFYIGQCLFNSLAMMFEQLNLQVKNLDMKFYLSLTGLVIFAYLTQNFMTRAIMLKKPSYIMPLGYITIILAALMDYVIFGSSFSTLSIVGMFLTSSGLLVKVFVPQDDVKFQKKNTFQLSSLKEDQEKL